MVHPVQSVIDSLYAAGRCPRLHVNATCEGVVCPEFIREQWQERLIIDLDATYPLDLTFGDEGIGADLSFGGYVTRCVFPWGAIYVIADRATGRGVVLDQNMPESVRRSRGTPTTGPLPTGADLRDVFELNRSMHGRRNRRKPSVKQTSTSLPGGPQPLSEANSLHARGSGLDSLHARGSELDSLHARGSGLDSLHARGSGLDSEREEEVQRRRAAFKVINGGG